MLVKDLVTSETHVPRTPFVLTPIMDAIVAAKKASLEMDSLNVDQVSNCINPLH